MKKNVMKTSILLLTLALSIISCEKDSTNLLVEETVNGSDYGTENASTDSRKSGGIIFTEVEPNNTLATANGPVIGDNIELTGTASSTSDADWFKLSCTKNKDVTVYLTGSSPYVNCIVYDKNGLALKTLVLNGSYTFTTLYDGNYFIKAGGYPNVSYSISVTKVEANSHLSTTPGSSISRVTTGTTQTFDFTLSSSSYVTLYINGATPYVNFTVYDSQNNCISGTSSIVDEQAIVFDNLAAGAYYVKVSGYSDIAYKLYFNPQYSVVNALYYLPLSECRAYAMVTLYKCGKTKFNNEFKEMGNLWYSHYGFSDADDVYFSAYFWSYYKNNFPILQYDGIPRVRL